MSEIPCNNFEVVKMGTLEELDDTDTERVRTNNATICKDAIRVPIRLECIIYQHSISRPLI